MIYTNGLQFSYDKIHFSFPDIRIGAGEELWIAGHSGTGKTTLLHLLGGLLKAQSGRVVIGGVNIMELKSKKLDQFRGEHIGIIFQQAHYISSVSVLDNMLLASRKFNGAAAKHKAMDLLSTLGISEKAAKKPAALSLGQQQRLSIARALMNKPALLLADEPTSSLDDENCIRVAELLQQQASDHDACLIVVSHDLRLQSFFEKKLFLQ